MARLFSCGFENQESIGNGLEGWMGSFYDDNPMSIDTSLAHGGLACARSQVVGGSSSTNRVQFGNNDASSYYFRFYMRIVTATGGQRKICEWRDDTMADALIAGYILLNTDNTIELWDRTGASSGNGVQIGSDSPVLSTNTWYRIEVQMLDNGTAGKIGTMSARIDGVEFCTGTASAASMTERPSVMILGCDAIATYGCTLLFDDVAINDDNGSAQNSWCGEGYIVHLRPNGAGDSAASTGVYSDIDEITPNDATDLITLTTDGGMTANYTLEDASVRGILSTDLISLVAVGAKMSNSGAGTSVFTLHVESQASGTKTTGSSISLASTSYSYMLTANNAMTCISYLDPQAGGAWTPALVDTARIGITSTDGNPDIRCTALWAHVEYIPVNTFVPRSVIAT